MLIFQLKCRSGLADRDPRSRTFILSLDERFEQRRVDLLARRIAPHELGERMLLPGRSHMRRSWFWRVLCSRPSIVFDASYAWDRNADDYRECRCYNHQRLPNSSLTLLRC